MNDKPNNIHIYYLKYQPLTFLVDNLILGNLAYSYLAKHINLFLTKGTFFFTSYLFQF